MALFSFLAIEEDGFKVVDGEIGVFRESGYARGVLCCKGEDSFATRASESGEELDGGEGFGVFGVWETFRPVRSMP